MNITANFIAGKQPPWQRLADGVSQTGHRAQAPSYLNEDVVPRRSRRRFLYLRTAVVLSSAAEDEDHQSTLISHLISA